MHTIAEKIATWPTRPIASFPFITPIPIPFSRNLGTASSVGEVDIGQYTNKFAIAYIYLASLSDLPKFLVAWSAQACCDRSNPA